jgi:DNA polymerase-3 subunit delta'
VSTESPAIDYDIGLPGNDEVRRQLDHLARQGRLHPCLLFEGAAGLGKAATARWLAQRLNCAHWPEGGPCGRCWSCRAVAKNTHPDVIEVGLHPERKTPIIAVSQARELLRQLTLRPHSARERVVIIDPADAMNTEAANALLKTLEEPPPSTRFVLISARARALLLTVRSRSQRVRFSPVAVPELEGWLRSQGAEDPRLLAELSEGCPGLARSLSEGEAERWQAARDAVLHALGGGIDEVFSHAETLCKGSRAAWRPQLELQLDALDRVLQDCWRWSSSRTPPRYNPDRLELVQAWAAVLQAPGVVRLSEAVRAARGQLDANVNGRLVVESLLARFATELGRARTAGRRG